MTQAFKGTEVGEEFDLGTAGRHSSCAVTADVGDLWLVGLEDGAESFGICTPGGSLDYGFDEVLDEIAASVEGEG